MHNAITVARKDVAQIVAATFPSYRGRKIRVQPREKVTLHGINWSGGSRSQYRACTIDGQPAGGTDQFAQLHPARNPAEGTTLPIPPGMVLVEHVIFCGKDLGLRIYCNPADMPKHLTAA